MSSTRIVISTIASRKQHSQGSIRTQAIVSSAASAGPESAPALKFAVNQGGNDRLNLSVDDRDGGVRTQFQCTTGLRARRTGIAPPRSFDSAFLIFFPLQLGLWRYLSTNGMRRRFWLGFEAAGLAATLALSILSVSDLDSTIGTQVPRQTCPISGCLPGSTSC